MVPSAPLRALLVVSTAYFVAMSCAHWCVSKCRHDKLAGSSSRNSAENICRRNQYKVPVLYVFWDGERRCDEARFAESFTRVELCSSRSHFDGAVPSTAYQDKIISFCAAVYAIFFATAASHAEAVPGALVALAVTVLGLAGVTRSTDLAGAVGPGGGSYRAYVGQTLSIAALLGVLSFLHFRQRAHTKPA